MGAAGGGIVFKYIDKHLSYICIKLHYSALQVIY